MIIGIQAVEKELEDALEKNGVKGFKSIDKKFNPEFHHAVSKIHSQHPEGTIVEELQRGFMIDERLLRPAMVAVSMGPEKKNSPEKWSFLRNKSSHRNIHSWFFGNIRYWEWSKNIGIVF